MIRLLLSFSLVLGPALPAFAASSQLVEPQLRLVRSDGAGKGPRVALTFDACMGKTDFRILSMLIDEKIPATLFVTARWLARNPQALALIKDHPDLFEIENHGQNHVPAVDMPVAVYGIPAAGTPEAVAAEVNGGVAAMSAAGISEPRWFRGATAVYSPSAIAAIRKMGFRVAGYSVNGDGGSLLGAKAAETRIAAARDGDVVIAHINQPGREAGEGVVRGIAALKARGVTFVRLQDANESGTHDTVK